MPVPNFPTAHCHPASFDSASTPQAFLAKELELGSGYITATDHGSMAACRQIYDLAQEAKITPILGVEAYFRDDECSILRRFGLLTERGARDHWKYAHITLHCLDQPAYEALCRVLSRADTRAERHGSERKPLFGWADLEELGAFNITAGSGCLVGMVSRHLVDQERPDVAAAYYERIRATFRPGNFYAELFPHDCSRNWDSALYLESAAFEAPIRLPVWKKLRVRIGSEVVEGKAEELGPKWPRRKAEWELLAVMENRRWAEREPAALSRVHLFEGFLQNECRPWWPDGDTQAGCNKFVLQMAAHLRDSVLISDDAHFVDPRDKAVQDVVLRQRGSWRFAGSYHRQTGEQAQAHFARTLGWAEADFERAVESARAWAARFTGFKFDYKPSLPSSFYPKDTVKHLGRLIADRGRMRWDDPGYCERLAREIKLFRFNGALDILPYFFIGEEVCALYRKARRLTGAGRGSAAGLLIAYLLKITHVNPLEYGLSLERFMTLDRLTSNHIPDIDQDLDERDLLIGVDEKGGWLQERFPGCVAQISTRGTLKVRSACKDAVRTSLGYVPDDVEELTTRFLQPPQGVTDYNFVFGYDNDDGTHIPGSMESDLALQAFCRAYPQAWEVAVRALGVTRQFGRHASAFVITDRPLVNFIPLTTVSDVLVTQFDMNSVESQGGVKMDYLNLRTLRDLGICVNLVQQRHCGALLSDQVVGGELVDGHHLVPTPAGLRDVYKLPEDDEVYWDIVRGDTDTVFQCGTPGAKRWLRPFEEPALDGRPTIRSYDGLSAFVALNRPGPLDALVDSPDGTQHNLLVEYARRARGLAPAVTVPAVEALLPETFGLLVYQEQLQRVYQELTGCSLSDAESFRRLVAKKKVEKLNKTFPWYLERAAPRIGEAAARDVWKLLQTWANYGFNKSHSVCYAVTAYACAYFKRRYPLEWWGAVLRNADKRKVQGQFWPHCRHLVLLPDVRHSRREWAIEGDKIRAPLALLQGVGPKAMQELDTLSGLDMPDVDAFCRHVEAGRRAHASPEGVPARSSLTRGVVYPLIVAGAMDGLFPAQCTTVVDRLAEYERALAEAGGKKRAPVDKRYVRLNSYQLHLLRKRLLPAYTVDLLGVLKECGHPAVQAGDKFSMWCPRGAAAATGVGEVEAQALPMLDTAGAAEVDGTDILPSPQVVFAFATFCISVVKDRTQRGANFLRWVFDVNGESWERRQWPDEHGGDISCPEGAAGALVVLALRRRQGDRDCSVRRAWIVEAAVGKLQKE